MAASELPTIWGGRATSQGTGVPHGGSDVLHHPARAVVPPPRLRAKWVSFSALLHLGQNYAGWGSDPISEFGNTCGTLRRYVVFNEACANEQAGRFGSRLGKRVSFFEGYALSWKARICWVGALTLRGKSGLSRR